MDDELRLLHSAQAGDMERLRAQALRLAEEKRQLEQVVKDFSAFVNDLNQRYGYGAIREAEKQSLLRRAIALLEQEGK